MPFLASSVRIRLQRTRVEHLSGMLLLCPGVVKLFTTAIYELVVIYCLCLAGLYSPVQCLRVRPEPTRVRHLSDTPLHERLRPYLQTDKTGKACQGQTLKLITNICELGMREVISVWFVFLLSFSPKLKSIFRFDQSLSLAAIDNRSLLPIFLSEPISSEDRETKLLSDNGISKSYIKCKFEF
jgi:hypothetical protein